MVKTDILKLTKKDLKNPQIAKIISILYDYQNEALFVIQNNKKGIIILPTGTGKTYLEAAIIAIDIIRNQNKFGIYVINAPRIMLSFQLLKEMYSFLLTSKIDCRYMCVHSGGAGDLEELEKVRLECNEGEDDDIKFSQMESGTSIIKIKTFIETAKEQNLPLIFLSTYNSCERINSASVEAKEIINIMINDEAQYIVEKRFFESINNMNSVRNYFFTATPRYTKSSNGRGMNNVEFFGNILYKMTPRDAINRGKMVRPRLHILTSGSPIRYDSDDFQNNLGLIIKRSFYDHDLVLNGINPKMLITVEGVGDIVAFFNSIEYKEFISNGVDIYAVASNKLIGNNINGIKTSRQKFLKRLKEAGRNRDKKFIVLHWDILSEGIDVPGFTGWIPLRILTLAKFLQSYGRIARIHEIDKENLKIGKILTGELDKFIKPYGWIIIPDILYENNDNLEYIKATIENLRNYGLEMDQVLVTDNSNGLGDPENMDGTNKLKKNNPSLFNKIEEINSTYEDEITASLVGLNELLPHLINKLTKKIK